MFDIGLCEHIRCSKFILWLIFKFWILLNPHITLFNRVFWLKSKLVNSLKAQFKNLKFEKDSIPVKSYIFGGENILGGVETSNESMLEILEVKTLPSWTAS